MRLLVASGRVDGTFQFSCFSCIHRDVRFLQKHFPCHAVLGTPGYPETGAYVQCASIHDEWILQRTEKLPRGNGCSFAVRVGQEERELITTKTSDRVCFPYQST